MAGRQAAVERLIREAADGTRQLDAAELEEILAHVAQAGFDRTAEQPVTGRLVGHLWQGRPLRRGELVPTAVAHYLKHAIMQAEWPPGTSFDDWLASLRTVILDHASGVLACRYQDKGWQLAFVRPSGTLRGPGGHEWVMVEYRVSVGHWMTAFQLREGLAYLRQRRQEPRWLRRPQ